MVQPTQIGHPAAAAGGGGALVPPPPPAGRAEKDDWVPGPPAEGTSPPGSAGSHPTEPRSPARRPPHGPRSTTPPRGLPPASDRSPGKFQFPELPSLPEQAVAREDPASTDPASHGVIQEQPAEEAAEAAEPPGPRIPRQSKFQLDAEQCLQAVAGTDNVEDVQLTLKQVLQYVRKVESEHLAFQDAINKKKVKGTSVGMWVCLAFSFFIVWLLMLLGAAVERDSRLEDSAVLVGVADGTPAATGRAVVRSSLAQLLTLPEGHLRRISSCSLRHNGQTHGFQVASLTRSPDGLVTLSSPDRSILTIRRVSVDVNNKTVTDHVVMFTRPFIGEEVADLSELPVTAPESWSGCDFDVMTDMTHRPTPRVSAEGED